MNIQSVPAYHSSKRLILPLFLFTALVLAVWFMVGPSSAASGQAVAGQGGPLYYMPLLRQDPPLAVPQFVKKINLPNAQCPNSVAFNKVSGYVYVANNFSYNVSVFKNTNFVTDIPTGNWPTFIAPDNDSAVVYITVLHDRVTVVNGTTILGYVPDHYEPYDVIVNPVNGYAYATDLDSTVQVMNGTTLLADVSVTDPESGNGAGWLQPIVVDPNTGLVYVASWSHGKMYVLDGTNVVANYRAGWGVKDMAIAPTWGYIYLAHSEPNATYTHNISVFNLATHAFTYIDTDSGSLNNSRAVAVNPINGYAYFTNPDQDNVTVVKGTQVIATLPAGDTPWDVAVNPNTGHVFVANRGDGTITVYDGLNVINTIASQGLQPFGIGIDTTNNDIYIANRGDEYGLFQCRDASVTVIH